MYRRTANDVPSGEESDDRRSVPKAAGDEQRRDEPEAAVTHLSEQGIRGILNKKV
jgi:hypothetical protein